MNCPKCNAQGLPAQNFCRACGSSLQLDTNPLAETIETSQRDAKILRHWPQMIMLGGFTLMFIGFATVVIGATFFQSLHALGAGMLFVLASMFLIGVANLWRRTSPKAAVNSTPQVLHSSQPQIYLQPDRNIEYLPSVTEPTTNLLPQQAATTQSSPPKDRV